MIRRGIPSVSRPVIEVWESHEALQRFFEEQLAAALAAANINIQPRIFEVVNSVRGDASDTV
ncbi:MAG TPA: hypothetical protein VGW38_00305 [Chloroflexota bacterium]|nr:hypothetical protein [Chloroflexota bacterium]